VVLTRTKSRVSYVAAEVSLTRESDPVLRHVLAPAGVPAGTAEVIGLLDELGVAPDATAAVAMRTLKTSGHGRRKTVVLAALKVRRDRRFPKTGNHASSEGTKNREPTSEPSQAKGTTSQVSAVAAVPGTNGNQRELATLSSGTRFPLSIGEPVPDWPENDDLEAAGYPSDGEEWK